MTCCRVHSVVDPAARALRSPSMHLDAHARPSRAVAVTAVTALIALTLLDQLVRVRLLHGDHGAGSMAVAIIATGLVLSEIHPTSWTRNGDRDGVTRGWALAYALILLGSPIVAITVMLAARWYVDLSRGKSPHEIVFDSAQIVASLSMGGLVLAVFGVHGNISSVTTISIGASLGIVLGGLTIFVVNGLLSATMVGLEQDAGFVHATRAAFRWSKTADGALLVLAPVFAIGVESNVVALPIALVAIWLAYRTGQEAIVRRLGLAPDPLTGLAGRVSFERELVATLRSTGPDESVAVLVMDLDRFRQVNDRFGHQVGDLVLVSFAERLRSVLPPGARAGRLAGDEFAACFRTPMTSADLGLLVDELHDLLVERHSLDGATVTTSASVGVAVAPTDGDDVTTLVDHAGTAMRTAKRHRAGIDVGEPPRRPKVRRSEWQTGAIATPAQWRPLPATRAVATGR